MNTSANAPKLLLVAVTAALLTLAWQALIVRFNYDGNWTALFRIGKAWPLPPELSGERVRIFDDAGYDGVFYHLVAHDPWLDRGFSHYADNASLRWRRILIPGLAHIAAVGRDQWIHPAYVVVNLLFIFAGAYWLAAWCTIQGLDYRLGLAFLLVPAVLVSIDRLTVDTALAALTIGFVHYASAGKHGRSHAMLALCPLARETGIALTAGRAWQQIHDRNWRQLALVLSGALPIGCWVIYVAYRTPRDATPWLSFPLAGIVVRTLHPIQYPITGRWVALAAVLDYAAVIGIWIALAFTARLAWRRRSGLLENCVYAFALGAILLGKADIWAGAYEFGRTMSPLLILLGLLAVREKSRGLLLPFAFVLPRILLQYEPQVRGLLRHLVS